MFFYLSKLLFSGFRQFKAYFVRGQNNSKYHDWSPLITKPQHTTHLQMLEIFPIVFCGSRVQLFINPLSGFIHFTQILMEFFRFFQSVKPRVGQRLQPWELFFNVTLERWGKQLDLDIAMISPCTAGAPEI